MAAKTTALVAAAWAMMAERDESEFGRQVGVSRPARTTAPVRTGVMVCVAFLRDTGRWVTLGCLKPYLEQMDVWKAAS